jgi:hypothetical protein
MCQGQHVPWRDKVANLADAILALQVISDLHPVPTVSINKEADVDGDGRIGMAEAIYILKKVAGMRLK